MSWGCQSELKISTLRLIYSLIMQHFSFFIFKITKDTSIQYVIKIIDLLNINSMNYSGKTEKRQKSINKICYSEFEHALNKKQH